MMDSHLGERRRWSSSPMSQGNEDEPQHVASSSSSTEEIEMVITTIQATDVAIGLKRLPAGFYVVVHHSGLEWRTENKRSSVNDDVVEWCGLIPLPSDLSATIRIEVYASFEFEPTLGVGEQLRRLTITVEELLDHRADFARERDGAFWKRPRTRAATGFRFFPKDGDVVSPCSSLSVTVQRRKRGDDVSPTSRFICPQSSTTEPRDELEDATNSGHSALLRYRRHGDKQDLEHSIEEFWRALRACPVHHPCRAAAQSNLAMTKLIHCRVEDVGSSMELPLGLLRDALTTRPVGHFDRPSTLIHLAAVHLARFEKSGDRVEEARTKKLLDEAVSLSSGDSHEHRTATVMLQVHEGRRVGPTEANEESSVVSNSTSRLTDEDLDILSARLLKRFERFGDVADLEQAIGILKELRRSTSIRGDQYLGVLGNLGAALLWRFDRFGELRDLEHAISALSDAVDLTPDGHLDKPIYLNSLGSSFSTRFERYGELRDLEHAISMLSDAVELTPHGHPDRPGRLTNLGSSFFTRFERFGELRDLEHAISKLNDAVELTPHGHPGKPTILSNLGSSFTTRFKRFGQVKDLERAISMLSDAVKLTPHGHPGKPAILSNLGNSFRTRFKRLGELSDLEHAISTLSDVVELTPNGHPDKPRYLSNLGTSFETRFSRIGELSDLEHAILMLSNAVDLTPHDHPDKPGRLTTLGNSFFTRFSRLGELKDLDHAISTFKDAVELTPHGHPDKSTILSNLGSSFSTRFFRLGELIDLEHAISMLSDAVQLTPLGHPDKPHRLSNLGSSFSARFFRLGELSDLEHAISTLSDAVQLTPHGHPGKPAILNNLGISFKTRFKSLGELSDLDHAISMLSDAVELTPGDHPNKPGRLINLGSLFSTRFERLGELSDLEHSISMLSYAVDLTPHDHPGKPGHLANLGNSFRTRFKHLQELSDLEHAISTLNDAVKLTPHGHASKPNYLRVLGDSLKTHFDHFQDLVSLEQAISLYSYAASSPIGPIDVRFIASLNWILCAYHIHHPSLLHAYSVALSLLPQLAWIGLSLTHRYSQLTRAADLVCEAAAAALHEGFPETAVEWLEQGRSIVWGELFQLRSSYEDLESSHPDLAYRLRNISSALDHASSSREKSLTTLSEQTQGVICHEKESSQHDADNHRRLAIERDNLLREIRRLPGFEQFLLRKQFSHLRSSAHSGPVVILNAAEARCDALIVLAGVDRVIHVPLPKFTLQRAINIQNNLKGLVRDIREGKRTTRDIPGWESILPLLWRDVVRPVLDALAFSSEKTPEDLSRIFWCPTGPFAFLPIHAAGLYDDRYARPGHKVFDFVISSYAPTLTILVPPLIPAAVSSGNLCILAVPQPSSDGQAPLPGVATELNHIRDVIRSSLSAQATLVESSTGTVEEVLDLLRQTDWVHFATHGVQDNLDSGLCLANGRRLKLRDIIAVSRPRGGLAFLSACQTATGERDLSDEAIHFAAGMLYAGYGGVIGTMWSISDRLAPVVARHIYARLFENGARPDYREAARALHEAIGRVRESGRVSFMEWIPFIHVGL